jgi:hypothetical protein
MHLPTVVRVLDILCGAKALLHFEQALGGAALAAQDEFEDARMLPKN